MANEVFSAYARFFVQDDVTKGLAKIEDSAQDTSKELDDLGEAAGKNASGGLGSLKGMATGVVAGLGAAGAAIGGVVASVVGLAEATADTREDMGKLETAFTTQGQSVKTAHSVYDDFVSLLGETDQSVEAANHLAELTKNQKELAAWGDIAAGVYAKFGDSLPLEGLTEAANETAKVGLVTGPFADTLNWTNYSLNQVKSALGGNSKAFAAYSKAKKSGMSTEDAFNAALATTKDQTKRASMVTGMLTAAYGKQGKAYKQNNKDLNAARKAQSDNAQAMAKLGDKVRPLATAFTQIGTTIMNKAMPYIGRFANWFNKNLPSIKSKINGVITWFKTNWPLVASAIGGVVAVLGTFTAALAISSAISMVKKAIDLWRNGTLLQTIAQKLLNQAILDNPIMFIVSLIIGLIGFLIVLWKTNENFRNKVIAIWNGIKTFFGSTFASIKAIATTVWNGIKTFFIGIFGAIRAVFLLYVNGWKIIIVGVFTAIKTYIQTTLNVWKTIIKGAMGVIKAIFRGDFAGAVNIIKSTFGKVFSIIMAPINRAKDAIKAAIDRIKGFFKFTWKFPPLKMPHFTISGSLNPITWAKNGLPKLGVKWYAKGGIFDQATLLNTGSGFAGVGEAGPEAVAPIATLQRYVADAVKSVDADKGNTYVSHITINTGETSAQKIAREIERNEKRQARAFGVL